MIIEFAIVQLHTLSLQGSRRVWSCRKYIDVGLYIVLYRMSVYRQPNTTGEGEIIQVYRVSVMLEGELVLGGRKSRGTPSSV